MSIRFAPGRERPACQVYAGIAELNTWVDELSPTGEAMPGVSGVELCDGAVHDAFGDFE